MIKQIEVQFWSFGSLASMRFESLMPSRFGGRASSAQLSSLVASHDDVMGLFYSIGNAAVPVPVPASASIYGCSLPPPSRHPGLRSFSCPRPLARPPRI